MVGVGEGRGVGVAVFAGVAVATALGVGDGSGPSVGDAVVVCPEDALPFSSPVVRPESGRSVGSAVSRSEDGPSVGSSEPPQASSTNGRISARARTPRKRRGILISPHSLCFLDRAG